MASTNGSSTKERDRDQDTEQFNSMVGLDRGDQMLDVSLLGVQAFKAWSEWMTAFLRWTLPAATDLQRAVTSWSPGRDAQD